MDESTLLLLARVTRIESRHFEDPGEQPSAWMVSELEPVSWIRGGLDGDRFEVFRRYGTWGLVESARWQLLAGIDTVGAIVALKRFRHGWEIRRDTESELPPGYLGVEQRDFVKAVERFEAARNSLELDSLVAAADLIAIVSPVDSGRSTDGRSVLVRVERLLKGAQKKGPIQVRPWSRSDHGGRALLILASVGDGVHEPRPFHRPLSMNSIGRFETADSAAVDQATAEVESALAHVSSRASAKRGGR